MSTSYLTVQALTKYIKRKFDADPHLRDVYVKGELSNVKLHSSGHIYVTLKDEKSRIRAAMFRNQAAKLSFKPEEGMQVFIRGEVNVYEANGDYQLYIQTMEPDGVGGLFVAFNQLKERLQKEGLFKPEWKQSIPKFPQTIGVLTATTGAAVRDICTTLKRRYPLAAIEIYPTLVQGKQAAPSIVKNIAQANHYGNCDVLIIGRGGGSIEDLWAFNEETVARAIFESRIPIISAVGHETDTTIADYVADLRAPTPTAAAELVVPNQQELRERIFQWQSQLTHMVRTLVQSERKHYNKLASAYPLQNPARLYRPFVERLAQLENNLQQSTKLQVLRQQHSANTQLARLQAVAPQHRIAQAKRDVSLIEKQLQQAMQLQLTAKRQNLVTQMRTLTALNPLATLTRGFQITRKDDAVITAAKQLQPSDSLSVQFQDGIVEATVTTIHLTEGDEA